MKKHPILKIVISVLAVILIFLLVINIIPPKKNVDHSPFVLEKGALPMIAAHRGGGVSNPENTLLAFREAVYTIGVDIIESDLYLTKDGYLVYNHDAYIDRTCNINGDLSPEAVEALCEQEENRHYISDMTLDQLRQYNFGYYFEDRSGVRIYKDAADLEGLGLQIATADQLFAEFYESNPELLFIVEIKNDGEAGREACRILYETLRQYPGYLNRIVIGTFHDEIEEELKTSYPDLLRGASMGAATDFIVTQYLGVNLFNQSDFACLQIPTSFGRIPLDSKGLIDRAHRRNIAVQYWTINDADEMRHLIELGCDCIMTDDPELLKEVLAEYC